MAALPSSSALPDSCSSRHHTYSRKQKSLGLLCSKYDSFAVGVIHAFLLDDFKVLICFCVLCSFLSLYNHDGVHSIGLDDAASRLGLILVRICCMNCLVFWFFDFFFFFFWNLRVLVCTGVERRRIYDIVNVLESVGVGFLFWFLFWSYFVFVLIPCMCWFKLVFSSCNLGSLEKGEESVQLEWVWGNP